MKTYTVNQLARLAGVSVRTLHHYDEIGILRPAFTGENRYRYYGEDELLRLQQILIHRELDIPLAEIGAILDAPGFDRLSSLQQQRERLEEQAKRYAGMVRTIDRTIARLKGEKKMSDADLYSGIVSPEKQAEYEAWLRKKYGPGIDDHIAVSRRKLDALSDAERSELMDELKQIENDLAEGLRKGIPPQSTSLDPAIARHRDWVSAMWNQPAPIEAYAGLADTYLAHPDFVARYESIEKGFAEYLATAMKSWARRQG
ncbi:MAG: MerR family transcriptional regulator [Devosia sp.]|uniref:MerR family transcriptional regulator n=1 Tax=Devosia sp. TaxID=1871048 RepID=UPI0024C9BD28|nr:MerR family transcriptional regulator [Devosia sp.]UYO00596.1 MAG: MerR family transcriptional regulator [Devosia sp.]